MQKLVHYLTSKSFDDLNNSVLFLKSSYSILSFFIHSQLTCQTL